MTALGIRVSAWQGLSNRDKVIVRMLTSDLLELGQPARFAQPNGTEWFVFDDHRFKLNEVSWFGALIANLGDVPAGYEIPTEGGRVDKAKLRRDAKQFLQPRRVWPVEIPEDDPNPWQTVLDAQGAPNAVRMCASVPDNWTPVSDA